MLFFPRIFFSLLFWIGSVLQIIIRLFNNIKRERLPQNHNELLNISAVKLVQKLKECEITSEELVREYIKRIKAVNPVLNAIIEDRFSDAVEDARKVDEVLKSTADKEELFKKYPLFGIPFTVKESCAVEGLSHAVGSPYRRGLKASEDSVSVSLLRQSGAIPLLVSASPELCLSTETFTLTHGRCYNPYNTEYTPGGSSGGEGSLNAAGATVFGVGSDMSGSIRIPAMFSGVYGHKPSGGLVSPQGHFPNISHIEMVKAFQIGPITRFAEDLPLLLNIMAGDNASKLIEPADIDNIKIYHVDLALRMSVLPISKSIKEAVQNACNHFESKGNEVRKLVIDELRDIMEIVISKMLLFPLPSIHENLWSPEEKTTTLAEYGKLFTGKAQHTLPALYFQSLIDVAGVISMADKIHYIKKSDALASKLKEVLGNDGVLFFPTFHRPAFFHSSSIFYSGCIILSGVFNAIGFPCLHVPTGINRQGLPIGFQIVAAPYADKNCFKIAMELKKAFGGWVPPT